MHVNVLSQKLERARKVLFQFYFSQRKEQTNEM